MMSNCFTEIESPQSTEKALPEWIECYVITNIDPKCCGPLTRDLNAILPLRSPTTTSCDEPTNSTSTTSSSIVNEADGGSSSCFQRTDHLKRIRRRPATSDELSSRALSKPDANVNVASEQSTKSGNTDTDNQHGVAQDCKKQTSTTSSHSIEGSCTNDGHDILHPQKRSKPNTNGVGNGNCTETATSNNDGRPKKKKKKKNKQQSNNSAPWSLDILVGSVEVVDHYKNLETKADSSLNSILEKYQLSTNSSNFIRRTLPGRSAYTKDELDHWNKELWPTLFFEEKTDRYKEEQKASSSEEIYMMIKGMKEAVQDGIIGQRQWKSHVENNDVINLQRTVQEIPYQISGAVVMNPAAGSIVSRASDERQSQGMADGNESADNTTPGDDEQDRSQMVETKDWSSFPDEANPLCTSVLLAIQGVSRKERKVAMGRGMGSSEFRSGQYLCTGYDVYLTKEPNVYEAMALVHSRVRRVVFGVPDKGMGGIGGVVSVDNSGHRCTGIHSLPGTNHHYRAFRLDMDKVEGCGEEVTSLIESLKRLQAP